MTKNIAVYAGTFDPITLGHVDIIKRAACLFDQVIIGVAKSERKTPFFPLEKRMMMVEAVFKNVESVTVKQLPSLTVDFAKVHHANFLVRGLRFAMDYDYEAEIAQMNRQMSDNQIDTVFLPTRLEYAFISSSIVRELILLKAFDQLKQFVPEQVFPFLQ